MTVAFEGADPHRLIEHTPLSALDSDSACAGSSTTPGKPRLSISLEFRWARHVGCDPGSRCRVGKALAGRLTRAGEQAPRRSRSRDRVGAGSSTRISSRLDAEALSRSSVSRVCVGHQRAFWMPGGRRLADPGHRRSDRPAPAAGCLVAIAIPGGSRALRINAIVVDRPTVRASRYRDRVASRCSLATWPGRSERLGACRRTSTPARGYTPQPEAMGGWRQGRTVRRQLDSAVDRRPDRESDNLDRGRRCSRGAGLPVAVPGSHGCPRLGRLTRRESASELRRFDPLGRSGIQDNRLRFEGVLAGSDHGSPIAAHYERGAPLTAERLRTAQRSSAAHSHCLCSASGGVWHCCLGRANLSTAVLPDPVKLPVIRSWRDPSPPVPENVPLKRICAGGIL